MTSLAWIVRTVGDAVASNVVLYSLAVKNLIVQCDAKAYMIAAAVHVEVGGKRNTTD